MQVPPGLSDFLTSSYQQYKEDTNTVASWLATTARCCGYPEDLLLNRNTANAQKSGTQTTGRLKGKARKEAKQAACPASATESGTVPRKPAYVIAIKDFTSLAEFIAAKTKSSVKAPLYFARTLDRAINVRKKHGMFAAAQVASNDSDHRHSFFVGILESVKAILAPIMPPLTTHGHNRNTKHKPNSETPLDKVFNSFATLHVEEPSQEFLDAPDVAIPERPPPEFEAEQLDDDYEMYTALLELFADLQAIRQLVCNLWVCYKFGQYDLIAISLVTNTAIDFVRAIEGDISALVKKHGGAEVLLDRIWWVFGRMVSKDQKNPNRRELPKDVDNPWLFEVAEQFMANAQILLRAFVSGAGDFNCGKIPSYTPERHGRYDPASNRELKTPQEKYDEDQALLAEYLPVAITHVRLAYPQCPGLEDEFLRGLRIVLQTGEIHFWNIFSTQLFLDVHHILRQDVVRPYYEMRKAARDIERIMDQNSDYHKNVCKEGWSEDYERMTNNMKMNVDLCIHRDIPKKIMGQIPGFPDLGDFVLLRKNPVYCGLWMYRLQLIFHDYGVAYTYSWGAILATCHVYHAVRHEKLLAKTWSDMEAFIELQGESVFGNRAPENAVEYARRYLLAIGVSASVFAKDSRNILRRPKAKSKMFEKHAPITRVFRHRFCEDSRRYDFTPEELKNIMEKTIVWGDDDFEVDGMRPWDVTFGSELSRHTRSQARRQSKNNEQAAITQRLKIPMLLKRMCNALQGEKFELTFDYFRMHHQSWKLLRSIKEDSRHILSAMDCHRTLRKEFGLPQLANMVFWSNMNNPKTTSNLLVRSAHAIEALIDSGEGAIVEYPPEEEGESEWKKEILINPNDNANWTRYRERLRENRADGSIGRMFVYHPIG